MSTRTNEIFHSKKTCSKLQNSEHFIITSFDGIFYRQLFVIVTRVCQKKWWWWWDRCFQSEIFARALLNSTFYRKMVWCVQLSITRSKSSGEFVCLFVFFIPLIFCTGMYRLSKAQLSRDFNGRWKERWTFSKGKPNDEMHEFINVAKIITHRKIDKNMCDCKHFCPLLTTFLYRCHLYFTIRNTTLFFLIERSERLALRILWFHESQNFTLTLTYIHKDKCTRTKLMA